MTKTELIEALKDFPDDLEVKIQLGDIFVCGISKIEIRDYYDDLRDQKVQIICLNQSKES